MRLRSFFATMFEEEDVLWLRMFDSVIFNGCFFFPWDWLPFFLSIDFINCIVLPKVPPILFDMILLFWFYLLAINYLDFAGTSLTLTDDSFILLITYCWFWQNVFCKSFSKSMIFLSLYLSSFWKALFMAVIF